MRVVATPEIRQHRQEGQKVFDALSEDGTDTMPYGDRFWDDSFGMVTDKFGISWMINDGVDEVGNTE